MDNTNYGLLGIEDSEISTEYTGLSYEDILPKIGVHVGLDISRSNSGVSVYADGELYWYNIVTEVTETNHWETEARRSLKADLKTILTEYPKIETLVIEDVFFGSQIHGIRILLALNTAIDELILDGEIEVTTFIRVDNKMWKSWLRKTDSDKSIRGANDKVLVQHLLARLGVTAEGAGAQDRLDSMGLLVGYFHQQGIGDYEGPTKRVKQHPLKGISFIYEPTLEDLENRLPREFTVIPYASRVSERNIRMAVAEEQEVVWYTPDKIHMGALASKVGLEPYPFGGYLAFCDKGLANLSKY